MRETHAARRGAAIACLLVAALAVGLLLHRAGGYTLHAHFIDAGQLVKGDRVQIAGKQVGSVDDIRLTDDNEADVVLRIRDSDLTPLHEGTIARVRAIGLAGIANRFVDLAPGPTSAPVIPDGGALPTKDTRPIVDLDAVLNALDPITRKRLQHVLRYSAQIFAGSAATAGNRALAYLDPALAQTHALAGEVVRDEGALQRLMRSGAAVFSTLAARRRDVEGGITSTAVVLEELARERGALSSLLTRAPGALRQGAQTLADLQGTLSLVRPALREARPVAPQLTRVLRRLVPTARDAAPLLAQLRALLPSARSALAGLPQLAATALPALDSTSSTLRKAQPVFAGLRPYAPDIVGGLFNALAGSSSAYYDANGHYVRAALNAAINLGARKSIRRGLTARCPGGAAESADDRSNPWIDDPSICNPEHDHQG
jgi:phospholipid/cholesterol/gamma-HCH transport system substrate-binding protein